jgi:hypothetical protein
VLLLQIIDFFSQKVNFFHKQSVKPKGANKQDQVLFLNLQYFGFQNAYISKKRWDIFSNFVALSQYLNFKPENCMFLGPKLGLVYVFVCIVV